MKKSPSDFREGNSPTTVKQNKNEVSIFGIFFFLQNVLYIERMCRMCSTQKDYNFTTYSKTNMVKIPLKIKKNNHFKIIKRTIECSGAEMFTVLLPSNVASPSLGLTIGPESEDPRNQWKNIKIYSVSDWEPVQGLQDQNNGVLIEAGLWMERLVGGTLRAVFSQMNGATLSLFRCALQGQLCCAPLQQTSFFVLYFSQISQKRDLNPTAFLCNSDRNNNPWEINMDVSETGIEDSLDEMCSCVTLSAPWTCINLLLKKT